MSTATLTTLQTLSLPGRCFGAQLDPSASVLVTTYQDALEVWSLATSERVRRIEGAFDLKMVRDRDAIFADRTDGALWFVPLDPSAPVVTGEPGGKMATDLIALDEGFALGDWNGKVTLRDARGAITRTFEVGSSEAPARLTRIDADRVLVHGFSTTPQLLRLSDGVVERKLALGKGGGSDTVHRVDATTVIVRGMASKAERLSLETGKKLWRVKAKHEGYAGTVRFGHYLLGNRNGLFLVDLETGVGKSQIVNGSVDKLADLPDGRVLAFTGDYSALALIDETGVIASQPVSSRLDGLWVHPTLPRALTWSLDGTMAIWNVAS